MFFISPHGTWAISSKLSAASFQSARFSRAFAILTVGILFSPGLYAQTISKANNSLPLNSGSSWVGGVVPDQGAVAQWDSSASSTTTAALGGSLAWRGLVVTDKAGLATVNPSTGAVLSLGAEGIVFGGTYNLAINCPLLVIASQTWRCSAGAGVLSLSGPINLGGLSVTIDDSSSGKILIKNDLDNGTVVFGHANAAIQVTAVPVDTEWTADFSGAGQSGGNPALDVRTTLVIRGVIGMTGAVSINSAASTLTLKNPNNVFPILSAPNGTIAFDAINDRGNASQLGIGNWIGLGWGQGSGRLLYTGGDASTNRIVSRNGGGVIEMATVGKTFTITGDLVSNSGATPGLGWSLGGAGNLTITGSINDAGVANPTSITKFGAGILTLAGANTYTGTTLVDNGTLLINGTAGKGDIVVGPLGSLGGVGKIGGDIAFAAGGSLQPGKGPGSAAGVLTCEGNLDLSLASITLRLFGNGNVAGADHDRLEVKGRVMWGGSLAINAAPSFDAFSVRDAYCLFGLTGAQVGNLASCAVDGVSLARNGTRWSGFVRGATCVFDQATGIFSIEPFPVSPPIIVVQPAEVSVPTGGSAIFLVQADGAQSHQWRRNGSAIEGATGASLLISDVRSGHSGLYDVVLSNNHGTAVSKAALLTVTPNPPGILSPPASATVAVGQRAILAVVASGADSYQWRRNGVAIANATSTTLWVDEAQSGTADDYDVVVANSHGITTSASARVRTLGKLAQVKVGRTETFIAEAGAATYKWMLDGVTVGGNGGQFVYTTDEYHAGSHWLVVEQTDVSGQRTKREWGIRVLIPEPAISPLNYYVSPIGSDANAGTLAAPFATLEAARDAIRALPRPLPEGGVTVWLRGGTYYRVSSFFLSSVDSGVSTAPIVYRAFAGELPEISGGKPQPASAFVPLASAEAGRVAPGVDPASIVELDLTAAGVVNRGPFPGMFNQWTTHNVYSPGNDGGLCEVIFRGRRMPLSRYPNRDLVDDNLRTTNLAMDGVVAGTANDGSGYLNGGGTYVDSTGALVAVGGAFRYAAADDAHVARWLTALTKGGLWLQGYWRVPWQINGVKVKSIDLANRVIALDSSAEVPLGIGYKYTRPVGNRAEPYWAINMLEEMDQPGEWAVDFSRNRLYFLRPETIDGNNFEISDLASPLVQMSNTQHVVFCGITFRNGLASAVQISKGSRNLILGCRFVNMNNYPVDLDGGSTNGVVSSDFTDMGGGGVYLRGGSETSEPRVPARNFAVNNRIHNFSSVTRVYAPAIDAGFSGAGGGGGGGGHITSVGMRVANNRVSRSPHGAILHGSFDHTFEYNDVSDFCQVSNDLGAFYSYDDFAQMGYTTFRYNFIHDSPHGDGIYFDNDHRGVRVYGNLINLRTLSTEPRGWGVLYKIGTQATYGRQQSIECFSNLVVNAHIGFDLWVTQPSVVEHNAAILTAPSPFRWTKITVNAGGNTSSNSTAAALQSGPNATFTSDPGFIDLPANDLRLKPSSPLFTDLSGFNQAPFELIGLYDDAFRSDAAKALPPFIVNDSASGLTPNSAVVSGTLAYPRFEANASVILYWGLFDGGTVPEAWQNSVQFSMDASGPKSATLYGLIPGTTYRFRYQARNEAGEHWAESSGLFTTPQLSTVAITPSAQRLAVGDRTSFSVVGAGTDVKAYQWRKNGIPIPAATTATLAIVDVQSTDAGTYDVVLTGTSGNSTLTAAVLAVYAPPPEIVGGVILIGTVGKALRHVIAAKGAPTWFTASELPLGLSLDRARGVIEGVPGAVGVFTVPLTATNQGGSSAMTALAICVNPAPGHSVVGQGYVAGETVTVANTVPYVGAPTGVSWQLLLPEGWSHVRTESAQLPQLMPKAGDVSTLAWEYTSLPPSPVNFSYVLAVPLSDRGRREIAALVSFRYGSAQSETLAKPDPLWIEDQSYNDADYDRNWCISLAELTRFIQLYNTRRASVRTGCYGVREYGIMDGFGPDLSRDPAETVSLSRYHNADSNSDGKIDATELLRLIALYESREGSIRLGRYHRSRSDDQAYPDGFAPGP